MDYASNNCEKRARELLAPLAGACPDTVWESVVVELETRRKETANKWTNKLAIDPKIPLIIASAVVVLTGIIWYVIGHKASNTDTLVAGNNSVSNGVVVTPQPKPDTKIVATVVQPMVIKKDSTVHIVNQMPIAPATNLPQQIVVNKKAPQSMPSLESSQMQSISSSGPNISLNTGGVKAKDSVTTRPTVAESLDIGDSAQ